MGMEVVGRHALLFDNDAMAAFVNSTEALVPWNSLLIDRYDVRHLLHSIPTFNRGCPTPDLDVDGVSLTDLDRERYLDLPLEEENSLQEMNNAAELAVGGNYQAVAFSYGNTVTSGDVKNSDPGSEYSGFHPPFPVPESLLKNLPPTEKVHQIIARTATFVSQHGGQSEIVLRVKQGDNPTFGFLMPDHHLHAYFRFLVDHQELLNAGTDIRPPEEEKKVDSGHDQAHAVASGALSLLGSVYGSGEDEDGALKVVYESKETDHDESVNTVKLNVDSESKETEHGDSVNTVNVTLSHGASQVASSGCMAMVVEAAVKKPFAAANKKTSSTRSDPCVTTVSSGTVKKSEVDTIGSHRLSADNLLSTTIPSMSGGEPFILEPPSSMKQIVDKIVEFIVRNGKEFEAILIEQNRTNGKFQFLLPSNHYHPYYLKVLQKAQELKIAGKSLTSYKHDRREHKAAKEAVQEVGRSKSKETVREMGRSKSEDIVSCRGSVNNGSNIVNTSNGALCDSDRKEKFKMVIGGPKKEVQDAPSKPVQRQCGMSEDAAAAIVFAATRGRRHPIPSARPRISYDDSSAGLSIREGAPTSSISSFPLSANGQSSMSMPVSNGEQGFSVVIGLSESVSKSEKGGVTSNVSVAKAIAKTAALAADGEADSSEASLTKEQKQKVERLKRAKMFAAMIKGGSQSASELLPPLSTKQPDSVLSDMQDSSGCKIGETHASSAQTTINTTSGAEFADLVAREREGSSAPVDVRDTLEKGEDIENDHDVERRSRKKHSSRSRRQEDDSDDNHKHHRKKHRSDHHSSHHSRDDKHKHRKSHSRHKHKHHISSEDAHQHGSRSHKHSRSHAGSEPDMEDGEIIENNSNKSDAVDVKGGEDTSLDCGNGQKGSIPSTTDARLLSDTTDVPDDLRAKVRAMLLATMQ